MYSFRRSRPSRPALLCALASVIGQSACPHSSTPRRAGSTSSSVFARNRMAGRRRQLSACQPPHEGPYRTRAPRDKEVLLPGGFGTVVSGATMAEAVPSRQVRRQACPGFSHPRRSRGDMPLSPGRTGSRKGRRWTTGRLAGRGGRCAGTAAGGPRPADLEPVGGGELASKLFDPRLKDQGGRLLHLVLLAPEKLRRRRLAELADSFSGPFSDLRRRPWSTNRTGAAALPGWCGTSQGGMARPAWAQISTR